MKLHRLAIVGLILLLTSCSDEPTETKMLADTAPPTQFVETTSTVKVGETQPQEEQKWTPDELQIMALTLAGECYDDKEQDKRLVCEVILNRVSAGYFGDSIQEVITAESQFTGYWNQSRPVSDNDLLIAERTLEDWFENDCLALSEYLFFSEGDNRENTFRSQF